MTKNPEQERISEEHKYLEDVILREYDFRSVRRIKGTDGAWRVVTDRGERFLKLSKCDKAELTYVRQVLEHVANRGFRRVCRFIVTKYGDPFVEDKGKFYYLTDWVDGKDCSFKKPAHLEEAVFTLAEFHRAACRLKLPAGQVAAEGQPVRQHWGQWSEMFSGRAEMVSQISRTLEGEGVFGDQFSQMIRSKAAIVYAWAVQAVSLLNQGGFSELVKREREEQAVCHGAFSASNIILSKRGKGAYLVDLDHSVQDVRIHDLARLMARVLPIHKWDIGAATQMLEWYSFIRPLDELEQKALVAYLAFPHRLFRYCRQAVKERNVETGTKLVRKLQEDLMLEEFRKPFIQQLMRSLKISLDIEL
ncbi:MAG TPA: CotS family spore coat protein [Bacillota bacterium]|nr:CotS family spore coat protein [Bacillota bacterium]